MKLVKLASIMALLAFTTRTAQAAAIVGTYCSAATTDGAWAFAYSISPVQYNCNTVSNALLYRTRAPVSIWRSGFYRANGINQAVATCYNGSQYYTGFGGQPLQLAYDYASAYGGVACVITVD